MSKTRYFKVASYRLSARVFKGKNGGTVISRAAYRAGQKLKNDRTGQMYDYTHKPGVVHAEMMFPKGTKKVPKDREAFWNAVEAYELGKRKDAQLAREIVISLPHELSAEERKTLARTFVRDNFVAKGMVADLCIRAPQPTEGDDPRNHHAHIMLTMRKVGWGGFDPVKTRLWNTAGQLKEWRANWADMQNTALARGQHKDRVDHRTLAAQAKEARQQGQREKAVLLERAPEIHVGPEARQIGDGEETIPSKKREIPRYGKGRSNGPYRNVYYPEFDQGNRAAYNQRIIERNAARAQRMLDQQQVREARLAERQRYYRIQKQKWEVEERERQQRLQENRRIKGDILRAVDSRHRYGSDADIRLPMLEDRIDWYAQMVNSRMQDAQASLSDRQRVERIFYDLLQQRRALIDFAREDKQRKRTLFSRAKQAKQAQEAFVEQAIMDAIDARKRKAYLDTRLAILERRIDHITNTIKTLRGPHNRLLRRKQQYRLRYFLRKRKQIITTRLRQQAALKQAEGRRQRRKRQS